MPPPPRSEDLDGEEPHEPEDPGFRRPRAPVRVRQRRGGIWAKGARGLLRQWKWVLAGLAVLVVAAGGELFFYHSPWFVIRSSEQISVSGATHAGTAPVAAIFASDLGRNIFFIPLEQRRAEIEALPWVRSAAVERAWPARLVVKITERQPVAFARVGEELRLVDGEGVLLPEPPQSHYEFPVLAGLAATRTARAAQMQRYLGFAQAVHSTDISELDLTHADDMIAQMGTVLVHFGDANYAARFALYQAQISAWKLKYPNLSSVDLRYDGQAILSQ